MLYASHKPACTLYTSVDRSDLEVMYVVVKSARRGLMCLALSAAVVAGSAAAPGFGATAEPAAPAEPKEAKVAVLSPMISTMEFGATVGFPLMCNTGAGTLSVFVAQIPGASEALTPGLSQLAPFCADAATQGGAGLQKFNESIAPLEAINPVAAPGFEAMTPLFEQMNAVAPSFQPFSGAITSLQPMVEFFGPPAS